ncbi:MAG TPA: hypothetical protein VHR45_00210 [Thermoanaerobaculia bacterium]|nr:hypothetical protein [Thermoanaerobaculia bacterium]
MASMQTFNLRTFDLVGHPMTPLAAILVGALLLFLGRRLFWVFVGVVGFMAGWSLSLDTFHVREPGVRLVVALLAGVVGVLLAIFLQKVAIALAGFVVGASVLIRLMAWSLHHLTLEQQLFVLLAGIVAAVLAVLLFDLALVVLSSVAGAGLILDGVGLAGMAHISVSLRPILLVILVVVGIAFQLRLLSARPARRPLRRGP